MCEKNVMTALSDINPFLPATMENVQALLIGVGLATLNSCGYVY
jgi:hypothetical protein